MNHEAIYSLYPNVVAIRGNEAFDADENLVVYDVTAVEKEAAKTAYISQRAMAYPSFADQFDTIFHDGLDAWKAQIQAVKDKYPKGK
jgi:hypothetical protein